MTHERPFTGPSSAASSAATRRIDWTDELLAAEFPSMTEFEPLGRGGFASVFQARHPRLSVIALKVLTGKSEWQHDDAGRRLFRERVEAEIENLGQLGGRQNIVALYESGVSTSGWPYLVMELCRKESVRDVLRHRIHNGQGPMGASQVVDIGEAVGRALARAHDAGILHLDVKPANILIDRYDAYKLSDFGIAQSINASQSGQAFFTLHYAAPEMWGSPAEPTTASDVYSLGATLFHLAAGRRVFQGTDDREELRERVLNERAPRLELVGFPSALTELIARCLAKAPAERPTAAEVLQALRWISDADDDVTETYHAGSTPVPGQQPAAPLPAAPPPGGVAGLPVYPPPTPPAPVAAPVQPVAPQAAPTPQVPRLDLVVTPLPEGVGDPVSLLGANSPSGPRPNHDVPAAGTPNVVAGGDDDAVEDGEEDPTTHLGPVAAERRRRRRIPVAVAALLGAVLAAGATYGVIRALQDDTPTRVLGDDTFRANQDRIKFDPAKTEPVDPSKPGQAGELKLVPAGNGRARLTWSVESADQQTEYVVAAGIFDLDPSGSLNPAPTELGPVDSSGAIAADDAPLHRLDRKARSFDVPVDPSRMSCFRVYAVGVERIVESADDACWPSSAPKAPSANGPVVPDGQGNVVVRWVDNSDDESAFTIVAVAEIGSTKTVVDAISVPKDMQSTVVPIPQVEAVSCYVVVANNVAAPFSPSTKGGTYVPVANQTPSMCPA